MEIILSFLGLQSTEKCLNILLPLKIVHVRAPYKCKGELLLGQVYLPSLYPRSAVIAILNTCSLFEVLLSCLAIFPWPVIDRNGG